MEYQVQMRVTRSHQSCEIHSLGCVATSYVLSISLFVYSPPRSMPHRAVCYMPRQTVWSARCMFALYLCVSDVYGLPHSEQYAHHGWAPLIWAVRAVSVWAINESASLTWAVRAAIRRQIWFLVLWERSVWVACSVRAVAMRYLLYCARHWLFYATNTVYVIYLSL